VGYTAEAAKSIVDACGPRLRPLEDQLQLHQKLPAKDVIKEQENNATRQFESFFEMVGELEDDGRSTAAAVRILDQIESAEAGSERPSLKKVPKSLFAADFSRLIFIGLDGKLTFQSRVHRNIWRTFRLTVDAGSSSAGSSRAAGTTRK
jgi:hypothetical protein